MEIEKVAVVLYFSRHTGREISVFIETDAALAYAKELIQGWIYDGYKIGYQDIPSRLLYATLGGEGDDIYVEQINIKDGPAIIARKQGMAKGYKWAKSKDGDNGLETCDCCQAEAPVDWFYIQGSSSAKRPLCKICAETFIGSVDGSRKMVARGHSIGRDESHETLKEIAHVANIMLLQLGAFGAPPEIKE